MPHQRIPSTKPCPTNLSGQHVDSPQDLLIHTHKTKNTIALVTDAETARAIEEAASRGTPDEAQTAVRSVTDFRRKNGYILAKVIPSDGYPWWALMKEVSQDLYWLTAQDDLVDFSDENLIIFKAEHNIAAPDKFYPYYLYCIKV